MTTSLRDVCFVHWPVPEATVDDVVPGWLTPHVADDTAWIRPVSTEMRRFDVFGLPVRENVRAGIFRTYVRAPGGDSGVYFLSMDVADRLVADVARRILRFPAAPATIERSTSGDGTTIGAARRDSGACGFEVTYQPSGPVQTASPDTLPSFLVERYRYLTEGTLGAHLCGSVGHDPWSLRTASASVVPNALAEEFGIEAGEPDLLARYSDGVEMRLGPPVPLSLAE